MTYAPETPLEFSDYDPDRSWRYVSPAALFGAVTLAFSLSAGAWFLDANMAKKVGATPVAAAITRNLDEAAAGETAASVRASVPQAIAAVNPYGALLDPAFSPDAVSGSFGQAATLGRDFAPPRSTSASVLARANDVAAPPAAVMAQGHDTAPLPSAPAAEPAAIASVPLPVPAVQTAEGIPLPAPRPPQLRFEASQGGPTRTFGRRVAQLNRSAPTAAAPADSRNFIEKLFGMPQPSGPAMAYATPEDGLFGRSRAFTSGPALSSYDRWTAVYDISAHTVYLPSGARLEAHSGLGPRLDDPTSVSVRDRGATPPAVYDLKLREALFHGVQALRMTPVGGGSTFGRDGFLAHTYMLGPNGDSNGCVSFKNYDSFLQAYTNGEIKRLAVVARSS